ncbi:hypothetical protein ACFR9U_16020 [Halorientalis brevis]|uniref:Uncharacterized protein n=1 Tax=Halorientalis brevis TaxID=1126241 RepID=A0ABD6CEM0_9EURY|nr:hypothetical protein [Halorientalis brevis]
MTGLKSGSGDDLWADDDDNQESTEEGQEDAVVEDKQPSESEPEEPTIGTDNDVSTESDGRPYIVRRAIKDKSVQFERDERLTFFVHDDVASGERELKSDLETELDRDIPKFDIREAAYRAALKNPDDVLAELIAMGYSNDS